MEKAMMNESKPMKLKVERQNYRKDNIKRNLMK